MAFKSAVSYIVAAILAAPVAAGVGGGGAVAVVDGLGGPVIMRAKTIDGVFGAASPDFTSEALAAFNTDVQSDGISTDGKISFLLSLTDVGISWVALIDDENQKGEFEVADSILGMSSTAPTSASPFINDHATDALFREDLGNGTQLVAGFFEWDSVHEGDGYAWGSLQDGDYVSFLFTREGPAGFEEPDLYQFLSYERGGWEIVATSDFTGNDQFGFSFDIIPAPGAIAVFGLAGLVRRRSRA